VKRKYPQSIKLLTIIISTPAKKKNESTTLYAFLSLIFRGRREKNKYGAKYTLKVARQKRKLPIRILKKSPNELTAKSERLRI